MGNAQVSALAPTYAPAPMNQPRANRAHDLPYVKGCFESWARWCHKAAPPSISNTGKLMQGVRGTICPDWLRDIADGRAHDSHCPQCGGRGKIDLEGVHRSKPRICPVCENIHPVVDGQMRRDLRTQFCGRDCFRCGGVGFVVIRLFEVNPATIRSTRHVGGHEPNDVCLLIDDLVTGWRELDATIWLARVVKAEFFWNNDQDDKAMRLRVSVSFFEKRLREAYFLTEQMLDQKMP